MLLLQMIFQFWNGVSLQETIISAHAKNLTTSLQLNPVCATFTLLVTIILK